MVAALAMVLDGVAHVHGGGGRRGRRPSSFYVSTCEYIFLRRSVLRVLGMVKRGRATDRLTQNPVNKPPGMIL